MPKIIGPDAHRNRVMEAVFRLVAHDGVEAASLHNVASEADLEVDWVQRYFTSAAELLIFIREAIYERVTRRLDQQTPKLFAVEPTVSAAERRVAVEDVLAEFLPIGEIRRREAQVWLSLSVYALQRPDLQALIHDFYYSRREGVPVLLAEAQRQGVFSDELDIPFETERLAALLTGLTIEALLHPESMSNDAMLDVLRQHLDRLSGASGDNG